MLSQPLRAVAGDWSERSETCERHGMFTARTWRGRLAATCPGCLEQERQAELQKKETERRQLLRYSIGLRGWLLDATLESYVTPTKKHREVLAAARAFVAQVDPEERGGLWLLGPPGVGKSHLGAAIAQAVVLQRGLSVRMMTPRDVVRELRATWRRDSGESETDVLERLGSVDLLVLDEFGVGLGAEADATQLFEVIDRRYQLCRPTVVLSNLNAAGVKAAIGDRMYDRLQHGAEVLYCDWPSHRRPAA